MQNEHCYYVTEWYILLSSMKRVFVETTSFRSRVDGFADVDLLKRIQELILENPEEGATVAGTGGLRKMRVADPTRSKGKRGGLRILYLDLPDQSVTFLLTLYSKGEKEDISSDEKKALRELVGQLKSMRGRK